MSSRPTGRKTNDAERELALALLDDAASSTAQGRFAEATATAAEAIELLRGLARRDPYFFEPELAFALLETGRRELEAGNPEHATGPLLEAASVLQRLAASGEVTMLAALVTAFAGIADAHDLAGHPAEALAAAYQSLADARRLAATGPGHEPALAAAIAGYGRRLAATGQFDQAATLTREAIIIYERLAAADPNRFLRTFATTLGAQSVYLASTSRIDEWRAVDRYARDVQARADAHPPPR